MSDKSFSAQAAGYSDWLAADEAALDYIATRIAPKFGVSDCGEFKCAEGATEISAGLLAQRKSYPGLFSLAPLEHRVCEREREFNVSYVAVRGDLHGRRMRTESRSGRLWRG